jgi:signal transduction histidine kinase
VALQNAQLYAQAERVAMLEERQRVAAEMHDGLGQMLSYLGLMTDQTMELILERREDAVLERLRKTREMIERATVEVRRTINSLMDESSSEIDFCERLENVVNTIAEQSGLCIAWQAESSPRCSRQVAEQVLNVTGEALKNVTHHANAKNVAVRVGETDGRYFVEIEDDGKGFDVTQPEPNGHFGLKIMQARAEHISGQLKVESEQGRGTKVTLTWKAEE